jgi:hypothetical protein
MVNQDFLGLSFSLAEYDGIAGIDLVFDTKSKSFALDSTPYGNILASLFINNKVSTSTIKEELSIGGWGASDSIDMEAVLGSDLWYIIQNGRLESSTLESIRASVYSHLSWLISDGHANFLDVQVDTNKNTGNVGIMISVNLLDGNTYNYSVTI